MLLEKCAEHNPIRLVKIQGYQSTRCVKILDCTLFLLKKGSGDQSKYAEVLNTWRNKILCRRLKWLKEILYLSLKLSESIEKLHTRGCLIFRCC